MQKPPNKYSKVFVLRFFFLIYLCTSALKRFNLLLIVIKLLTYAQNSISINYGHKPIKK